MHQLMAATLDTVVGEIRRIQATARVDGLEERPRWPMIVLRTPKGWTGPKVVDGQQVEGTFRAHQVPLAAVRTNPAHLQLLEQWMRSYRPEELFDAGGTLRRELAELAPEGARRMGANPNANGGASPQGSRASRFSRVRASKCRVPAPWTARTHACSAGSCGMW